MLLLLGVNHKTAPVEVRERLSFSAPQMAHALRYLRERSGGHEAAILSTCNRTELFVVGKHNDLPARTQEFLHEFYRVHTKGDKPAQEALSRCLYQATDDDAVRHLFRVASGVDSLILGESQILGQVKSAWETARDLRATGREIDELFRRAITCGKRARSETSIGRGALSVGSAAVEMARQIFGPLHGHTVLILGAGKMSAVTAKSLVQSGAKRVLVANRTRERAQELVEHFGEGLAEVVGWDDFPAKLAVADIVIASTRAPGFVVTQEVVAAAMKRRRGRPLFLVDIAVPRDIEPSVNRLEDVYLYDIDDLQGIVATSLAGRASEVAPVDTIIETELAEWRAWRRGLEAQPVLAALSRHAEMVRDQEVEAALAQLAGLGEREQEIVRALGRSLSAKLMHAPLRHLREASRAQDPETVGDVDALRRAFRLQEEASHGNGTARGTDEFDALNGENSL